MIAADAHDDDGGMSVMTWSDTGPLSRNLHRFFTRSLASMRLFDHFKQIPLVGKASIPDVSLSEGAFQFGRLTSGGCESLSVTLVNRGSIPASLHLDLSQHEEFYLERKKALAIPAAIPVGRAGAGGDAASAADDPQPGGGGQSRCSLEYETIRVG